jgi:hypothetical protein
MERLKQEHIKVSASVIVCSATNKPIHSSNYLFFVTSQQKIYSVSLLKWMPMGWTTKVWFLAGTQIFSSPQCLEWPCDPPNL